MATVASIMEGMIASLLNDQLQVIFTNTVQLPYFNIAVRDFKSKMELANIPVTNTTSAEIPISIGEDNIGGPDIADPDLPSGLVEIQGLYQKQIGDNNQYTLIPKYDFLPRWLEGIVDNFIPCWTWQEQIIKFYPANTDLLVKIDFIKDVIPNITNPDDDEINIIGAENYLGFRTAALCANFIGENKTRSDELNGEAQREWEEFEGISTKGRQSITTRRRPFQMAYRQRGGIL